ncbi:TIGR03088 family PEP-CTERM/XrtA system glycosyltransferase [Chitinimonas sp. BJB300]|uniref:TIGR03088 family PEP-CTERM/XrtA system glycosyltransferase n=1 Tax=Chitinimonas sp. BJB300 TaxID=1559339 RepID=UPI000C11F618|nr:TIGR03088 family PEP-CTERM/XrtA system glycosyltransferase [Chitinimonas sp. BJB300]PHV12117.1 sugar transferase [Chitinimonas sp. BJB300]TSJ89055.1 TIGR03088 family PEP-CTERM/XrtA system glycosyltransferase [Chitinimonas sp. BJB300]
MNAPVDLRPLVAHVVYRFDVGGLENGVVNLINRMPADSYRHVVIALTEVTDFRQRLTRDDVECIALVKPPGHALRIYPQLYRLFRRLRPAIVHSRNLAALEAQVPAWLAGVKVRIHGEHGRDVDDLDGSSRKYQWLRRLYRPFVTHYIALSRDLADYLTQRVGVPTARVTQIYNGVDAGKFRPVASRHAIAGCPFNDPTQYLIGTVGRMQTVKDQTNLAQAFIRAVQQAPALKSRLRLLLVGDGPLREQVIAMLTAAGLAELAWLPGARSDVADILQGLDCFVLPSLAEGVSNTILEAMACGLPVIATEVGGNAELLEPGESGYLVPAANPQALANAIMHYARSPSEGQAAGLHGRQLIERRFSLDAMVAHYQQLYDHLQRTASGAASALPVHSPQPPIND